MWKDTYGKRARAMYTDRYQAVSPNPVTRASLNSSHGSKPSVIKIFSCPSLTTYHKPPGTYHPLPITYYLLPITYSLFLSVIEMITHGSGLVPHTSDSWFKAHGSRLFAKKNKIGAGPPGPGPFVPI